MSSEDVIIVGSDTDAGKTVMSAYWLAAFDSHAYWKPVETGEPADSVRIGQLTPRARIHGSLLRLAEAVAPALAARHAGTRVPSVAELMASKPKGPLLIETFGGPLSPLDEHASQVEWIAASNARVLVVTPSHVGAVGRALQCVTALAAHGVKTGAVVLLGPHDAYAEEQIGRHVRVFSLPMPTFEAMHEAVAAQRAQLDAIRAALLAPAAPADVVARDRQSVWHPYTPLGDDMGEPLAVASAAGEMLHLHDGRSIIDAISSWWTLLHGHCHPPLVAALTRAAAELDHVIFAGATHTPGVALAEALLVSAKMLGGRVFYSDNGSTAVEVALKMAYQAWCLRGEPKRTRFVGFKGGYHGDTFGAMAVSRDPVFFRRFEPLLFSADIIEPHAEALDATLRAHRGEVAAVIIEPLLQAAGGMRMHTPALLRALWQVAREHDVLFIADEVMTGGGRLGPRWAHHAAGIAPDLVCSGKTLAGGLLPLAATLASATLAAVFMGRERRDTFFHGHSFAGHPLACAVALANEAIPTEPNVQRIEAFWRRRLPQARVLGSVVAIDVRAEAGYLSEAGQTMRQAALRHGVLLRPLGNVLYAMPPLATSDASLERIAIAFDAAISAVKEGGVRG